MLACVSVGTSVSSVVNSWSCRDETVIRGHEDGRGVVDTPTPRAPRGVRTRNPFRRKPGGSRDDAGGFVGREARDAPRGRRASALNPFTHARVEWSPVGQRADVRARGSEVAAPTLSLLRQFRGAPRGRKRSGGGRSKKSKAAREKICRRPLPKDPKSNISKASNLGARPNDGRVASFRRSPRVRIRRCPRTLARVQHPRVRPPRRHPVPLPGPLRTVRAERCALEENHGRPRQRGGGCRAVGAQGGARGYPSVDPGGHDRHRPPVTARPPGAALQHPQRS